MEWADEGAGICERWEDEVRVTMKVEVDKECKHMKTDLLD